MLPYYVDAALQAQSAGIDLVSWATVTWRAFTESLRAPSPRRVPGRREPYGSGWDQTAGRVKPTSAPPSRRLRATTAPPFASTACLTIASPSPEPGRVRAAVAR